MTNLSPAAQALLSALGCSAASTDQSTPTGCPPTPCRCPAMTEHQHPITPPPELVRQWLTEGHHQDYCSATEHAITQAARWASDQELEACINYFYEYDTSWSEDSDLIAGLRADRRPSPPSLKEQALAALDEEQAEMSIVNYKTIRAVLEQLDD